MKVKKLYHAKGSGKEVTTAQLIEIGVSDRSGHIEEIEAKVSHLTTIVAALIDRAGLSDAEVLEITGASYKVELDV